MNFDQDLTKIEILPDSRVANAGTPKNVRMGPMGWEEQIFCVSCSQPGGWVPTENISRATWFCTKNGCADKFGDTDALIPDEVFWLMIQQEQMERYGHLLTESELIRVVETTKSPLTTLLTQGR